MARLADLTKDFDDVVAASRDSNAALSETATTSTTLKGRPSPTNARKSPP